MLDLLKAHVQECQHTLEQLLQRLNAAGTANGMDAAKALAELGQIRLRLAKIQQQGF